jgi:hypothetical protein
VYDGDRNRLGKKAVGVKTTQPIYTQNPAVYAQVVCATWSGDIAANRGLNHTYVCGLKRIS